MTDTPYVWPWIVLMLNITMSFGVYMNLSDVTTHPLPAMHVVTPISSPQDDSATMRLILDITQYLVLFTAIAHLATYYQSYHTVLSRPTEGFICWMMFMIFVSVLPPFIYALSHTSNSILLMLSYAVLIISAVPAMILSGNQWRISNATTSILFACSSMAMRRSHDVRLVLIITLFGHYLSMATVFVSNAVEEDDAEQQAQQEGEPQPEAQPEGEPQPEAQPEGEPQPEAQPAHDEIGLAVEDVWVFG